VFYTAKAKCEPHLLLIFSPSLTLNSQHRKCNILHLISQSQSLNEQTITSSESFPHVASRAASSHL